MELYIPSPIRHFVILKLLILWRLIWNIVIQVLEYKDDTMGISTEMDSTKLYFVTGDYLKKLFPII